jgi:RNA polymerase sigma-70 factor (ECF subfamily)
MADDDDDERAAKFTQMYDKYYRAVVRFLVAGLRVPAADAEDIAQETFVRFWEAIRDYEGRAEWAFLEVIARRVYFNRLRAMHSKKRLMETEAVSVDDIRPWQEPSVKPPNYADRESALLIRGRFREALRALPPKQGQCVMMRLEGFKYEQIAAILCISLDAVKSRLRDAVKTLRAELADLKGLPWPDEFPEDES